MTEATAKLNSYRQSPRKVRLVARLIKGKKVADAKNQLTFTTKRATGPLHKLLNSAIANAKDLGMDLNNLFVKSVRVDGGKILYRRRPVSRGAAHPIKKRTSHIALILKEKEEKITEPKKDSENKISKSKKK